MLAYLKGRKRERERGRRGEREREREADELFTHFQMRRFQLWHLDSKLSGVGRPAARRPGSGAAPCSGCAAAAGLPSAASDAAAGRRTSAAGTALPCLAVGAAPAETPAHNTNTHEQLGHKIWTIVNDSSLAYSWCRYENQKGICECLCVGEIERETER